MASKTKILFLAANAVDTGRLRLDEEIREIEQKLRSCPNANSIEVISQWAVRPRDIMEVLMRYCPTVVHFSGHAVNTNEIIFEDEDGKSKPVEVVKLVNMLSVFKDSIRLVVLNACFSNAGSADLSKDIEYIVGTASALGDKAAIKFATSFYQALGFGYSVQTAFELAKYQITIEGVCDAEIFNLLIREGVDTSEPFIKRRSKRVKASKTTISPTPLTNTEDNGKVISTPEEPIASHPNINIIGQRPTVDFQVPEEYPQGSAVMRGAKYVPVEIRESLQRFQLDYPDSAKVAFLMMRFGRTQAHEQIVAGIKKALDPLGIAVVRADDKQYHDDLFPNVLTYVYGSGFGIAVFERIETEEFNPNVALEVGYMFALKKHLCLLKDKTLKTLHADLVGKLYRVFDPLDPVETIPKELAQWLKDKGLDKTA
jgi:hypothetical protein